MKRFSALVVAFMLAAMAPFAQAKTYVNGIDANYPPFSYIDEKGNPTGFDIESMNWIAKKMGFEVVHTPINWDGIIPALQAKKIDMICSGMSISEERKQAVNFSEPYYSIKKYIAVRQDSNLTADDVFKGKYTLGVQRGTNEHDLLQSRIDKENLDISLRLYDSPPMSVEDLLNGRIDAIAIDSAPAEDAIKNGKAIKVVGTYAPGDDFGVAINKENTELLNIINQGYELLKKDPYWQELHTKYLSK